MRTALAMAAGLLLGCSSSNGQLFQSSSSSTVGPGAAGGAGGATGSGGSGGAIASGGGGASTVTTTTTTTEGAAGGGGGGGAGGGASCVPPMLGEPDGDYFLALSAYLKPPAPITALAHVTTADDGSGGVLVTAELQPLDAHDRSTPRGARFTSTPAMIDAAGRIVLAFGAVDVDGAANAITPGLAIHFEHLRLIGDLCMPLAFSCGNVRGKVTSPLMADLTSGSGSHWTMVPAGAAPPDPVSIDCAMTPAGPPP